MSRGNGDTAGCQHGGNDIGRKGRTYNAPALVLSFCIGVCFATSNGSSNVSSSSVDSSSSRRGSSNPVAFLWAALLASVLVSDMVEVLSDAWKWSKFLYWVWNGWYGADYFLMYHRSSCRLWSVQDEIICMNSMHLKELEGYPTSSYTVHLERSDWVL
jgi:hypothetical protein